MDAIIEQVKQVAANADDARRVEIQNTLRDLQYSLDTKFDRLLRLASAQTEGAIVKIGTDLAIFKTLAESTTPLSTLFLAEKSGADSELLTHLLRCMASFALINEAGKDQYTPNDLTSFLAEEHSIGAMLHSYTINGDSIQQLPYFLKETNYKMITSNKKTAFQRALKTDLSAFEWLKQRPEAMASLGHAMAIQRTGSWLDVFPIEEHLRDWSEQDDRAVLVDIGGGFGQQAIGFKNKYPNLPGRIIVQDVPSTLAAAKPVQGIEFVEYDFFTPQPVKDAKFYYYRHIFHDWPDNLCVDILKNTVSALGPDSKILIDEVVLPDTGTTWQAAFMDITMMATLGGVERSRDQWENILDAAGLKITEIYEYSVTLHQGVIVAVPK